MLLNGLTVDPCCSCSCLNNLDLFARYYRAVLPCILRLISYHLAFMLHCIVFLIFFFFDSSSHDSKRTRTSSSPLSSYLYAYEGLICLNASALKLISKTGQLLTSSTLWYIILRSFSFFFLSTLIQMHLNCTAVSNVFMFENKYNKKKLHTQ